MAKVKDWDKYKDYFKMREFDSSDKKDSGKNMQENFMDKLYQARMYASVPFKIGSGYRTKIRNKKVGGVDKSSHLKGCACDINVRNSKQRYAILKGLILSGFKRFGIAKTFIHCDTDKNKIQNVTWYY